jgi:hypothetical protein
MTGLYSSVYDLSVTRQVQDGKNLFKSAAWASSLTQQGDATTTRHRGSHRSRELLLREMACARTASKKGAGPPEWWTETYTLSTPWGPDGIRLCRPILHCRFALQVIDDLQITSLIANHGKRKTDHYREDEEDSQHGHG